MRLQLALNVKSLDRTIAFYSEMFASPAPNNVRDMPISRLPPAA